MPQSPDQLARPRRSSTAPGTTVAARLRDQRHRRGWTQQELADVAGLSRRCVAGAESGERMPHPLTVVRLADALGVRVRDLVHPHSALAARMRRVGY